MENGWKMKLINKIRYHERWHKHKFDKFHSAYFALDERGIEGPCYEVLKCKCGKLDYPPGPNRQISIFKLITHLEDDPQNDNRWMITRTVESGRLMEAIQKLL